MLKHTSGGNLSGIGYGPALGKVVHKKSGQANKYSEKGYRDVLLNIDGEGSATQETVTVPAKKVNNGSILLFAFPPSTAQSELGGRQGSNACTIILFQLNLVLTVSTTN